MGFRPSISFIFKLIVRLRRIARNARRQEVSRSSWSELPYDLLEDVLKKLPLSDYYRFGAVCKSFRSVSSEKRYPPAQTPWMMFPGKGSRCLFSPWENRTYGVNLPEIEEKRVIGSTSGWLILYQLSTANLQLFNPFSRVQIKLPSVPSCRCIAFSSNPSFFSSVDRDDFLVMGIDSFGTKLRFCTPGDGSWKVPEDFEFDGDPPVFQDIVFYSGRFYAVDSRGRVVVCDIQAGSSKATFLTGRIPSYDGDEFCFDRFYLVESCGELFSVVRSVAMGVTISFKVFKLDDRSRGSKWIKVESLGGRAFFLGTSSSMSISARGVSGCRENCIYFADYGCWRIPDSLVLWKENGIFNLEDRSIEPCSYPNLYIEEPVWFSPNP